MKTYYLKGCTKEHQLDNPIIAKYEKEVIHHLKVDGEIVEKLTRCFSQNGYTWYPIETLTEVKPS
jgi:hypothetical protein